MWIFMPDAFVSIAEHAEDSRLLIIRARIQGDIERVFPEAQVMETPLEDYRFRASLSRDRVSHVIASRVMHMDLHERQRIDCRSRALDHLHQRAGGHAGRAACGERIALWILEPKISHVDLDT